MYDVELYTDGSYRSSTKKGGWGSVLVQPGYDEKRELSGHEWFTTSQRMEITAVIRGLECLTMPCSVLVVTDSMYIVNTMTKGWLPRWVNQGWTLNGEKPVKNQDLWERMIELCNLHSVSFQWVKGHNGHQMNCLADFLATQASDEPRKPKLSRRQKQKKLIAGLR